MAQRSHQASASSTQQFKTTLKLVQKEKSELEKLLGTEDEAATSVKVQQLVEKEEAGRIRAEIALREKENRTRERLELEQKRHESVKQRLEAKEVERIERIETKAVENSLRNTMTKEEEQHRMLLKTARRKYEEGLLRERRLAEESSFSGAATAHALKEKSELYAVQKAKKQQQSGLKKKHAELQKRAERVKDNLVQKEKLHERSREKLSKHVELKEQRGLSVMESRQPKPGSRELIMQRIMRKKLEQETRENLRWEAYQEKWRAEEERLERLREEGEIEKRRKLEDREQRWVEWSKKIKNQEKQSEAERVQLLGRILSMHQRQRSLDEDKIQQERLIRELRRRELVFKHHADEIREKVKSHRRVTKSTLKRLLPEKELDVDQMNLHLRRHRGRSNSELAASTRVAGPVPPGLPMPPPSVAAVAAAHATASALSARGSEADGKGPPGPPGKEERGRSKKRLPQPSYMKPRSARESRSARSARLKALLSPRGKAAILKGEKKRRCGLCELEFAVENLPGVISYRAIANLRIKWGEPSADPRKTTASALYDQVRLCVFCSQFFDPDKVRVIYSRSGFRAGQAAAAAAAAAVAAQGQTQTQSATRDEDVGLSSRHERRSRISAATGVGRPRDSVVVPSCS
eukprot:Rmarinus@m.14006